VTPSIIQKVVNFTAKLQATWYHKTSYKSTVVL